MLKNYNRLQQTLLQQNYLKVRMSQNNDRKVIHSIRTEVDSFGRKKYKLQEVALSGSQEEENHNNAIIDTGRHKSMLIARQEGLNIEKYIGKIQTNKKKKTTEVFYCDVCSEGFKCDMAYLTHLNSPAHNRKLGMNMKVKNVSLETVSSKISALINKKQQKVEEQQERQIIKSIENGQNQAKRSYANKRPPPPLPEQSQQESQNQNEQDSDQQNDEDQEAPEDLSDQKDQNAQQKEQQQQNEEEQQDSNELAEMEMMKHMGFANSFGSKKHKR